MQDIHLVILIKNKIKARVKLKPLKIAVVKLTKIFSY